MSIVFDRAVSFYDQTRGLPPHAEQWMAQAAREAAALRSGSNVLELGVGTGRIALPLVQSNEYHYVGVDLSRGMMNTLRSKPRGESMTLVQADVSRLPFCDGVFDAVVVVHVFHLVSQWQQAMDDAKRVLRRGGVLLHGQNWHDEDSPTFVLRKHLFDLCGISDEQRGTAMAAWQELRPQLEQRFGPAQEVSTPRWSGTNTPRRVIEQFETRIWSHTWSASDEALAHAAEQGRAWAVETFGNLDAPLVDEQEFRWEIYTA